MTVELTGSLGDALVCASQQYPAGMDQMVCFVLGGIRAQLWPVSSPGHEDTGKNNWKRSSPSAVQKMKHSVYLPVFA